MSEMCGYKFAQDNTFHVLNDAWLTHLKNSLKPKRGKMLFGKKFKQQIIEENHRLHREIDSLKYKVDKLEALLEVHKCLSPFVEYKLFYPQHSLNSEKADLIKEGYELCGISITNKAEVWKKK